MRALVPVVFLAAAGLGLAGVVHLRTRPKPVLAEAHGHDHPDGHCPDEDAGPHCECDSFAPEPQYMSPVEALDEDPPVAASSPAAGPASVAPEAPALSLRLPTVAAAADDHTVGAAASEGPQGHLEGSDLVVAVPAGKSAKLSSLEGAAHRAGRCLSPDVALSGRLVVSLDNVTCACCQKAVGEAVSKLGAVESVKPVAIEGRRGTFTVQVRAGESLAVRDLRVALKATKFDWVDLEVKAPRAR